MFMPLWAPRLSQPVYGQGPPVRAHIASTSRALKRQGLEARQVDAGEACLQAIGAAQPQPEIVDDCGDRLLAPEPLVERCLRRRGGSGHRLWVSVAECRREHQDDETARHAAI
jgi:hypothetical protein